MWLVYLAAFFGMVMFYIVPVHNPFLLQELGVEKSSLQALGLIVVTIVSAFMSMNYGKIAGRLPFSKIYGITFSGMAIGYALAGFAPHAWQVIFAMGIAGFGAGLVLPNGNTWLLHLAPPERRGRLTGGMTTAIFLGQFASPLITQPMVSMTSLETMHIISAGIMLLMALFFFFRQSDKD